MTDRVVAWIEPRASRLSEAALRVKPLRRFILGCAHALLWVGAWKVALELRFGGHVPAGVSLAASHLLLVLLVTRLATFRLARLFDGIYRYSGLPELRKILLATSAASFAGLVAFHWLGQRGVPRTLFAGEWLASVVAIGGFRMAIRIFHEPKHGRDGVPTLVVGAGDAGESLVRELQRMRDGAGWQVVGFVDDDRSKHDRLVHGVRVYGATDEATLRGVVERFGVKLAVLAMPTAAGERVRSLVAMFRRLGVRTQTVPSLSERLEGNAPQPIREINIEDLLRRDPVQLDVDGLEDFLQDKVVLVTGAGGSIGSELARQVLRFKPRQLLLLDHDENAIFFLERELRDLLATMEDPPALKPLIVDITNERRVASVFARCRPDVVLHAAAHKHVAMMESNSSEAAWNNVFGTQIVAEAAHGAGTQAFVLISTDKAVNPTSVMGATKRVCEMVIQHIAERSHTRFAAVRFGNVLGSNGSVVPLFREQIARGGPVTVTHPDVTRYFMTIPEAAQLVLQAGALGGTGQVFLLDMGKPVKILDLAQHLIELSGIEVEIEFTGLKSGEKLFEEMLLDTESCEDRPHPKIVVGRVAGPNRELFTEGLNALSNGVRMCDDRKVRRVLSMLVPEATLAQPVEAELVADPIPFHRGLELPSYPPPAAASGAVSASAWNPERN